MAINTPAALRLAVISNPGVFNATFNRAPKSVTRGGKTYLRSSATTPEQKLWFLAAVAQTNPSAIANIAAGSFSLDECYGLDPDRSGIDESERELRTASAAVGKARAAVESIKRQIRDAEARKAEAVAAQKKAQQVQVGDIFTAGISAAARNLYADGQVQIWQDRIDALKSGAMVGMAGQEGWKVPVNAGLVQLESALAEARAAESAAKRAVQDARAAYDAEARTMRQEEERQRAAAARDAKERQRAEEDARRRDEQAYASSGGGAPPVVESSWEMPPAEMATDPGYVGGGEEWTGEEEDSGATEAEWYAEELDTARGMFLNEADAQAYAEDVLGIDMAQLPAVYDSAYSFDRYYGADCAGDCDGHCVACDEVAQLRAAMLDADATYYADKITEEGEQGYGNPTDWNTLPPSAPPLPPVGSFTGAPDKPFDFMSVIPVIIAAVIALAPLLISTFLPPVSTHEATPPPSVQAELTPPPMVKAPEGSSTTEKATVAVLGFALLKFLA